MTARILTWLATARAGEPHAVLDGHVDVDATRCPQVTASLTLPFRGHAQASAFDPFTRAPVSLEVRSQNYVAGTLDGFGGGGLLHVPGSDGTLATLDWSSKASRPTPLEPDSAPRMLSRHLRLVVTDVTIDETAATMSVSLASPDQLLTELRNFGPDWYPAHHAITADGKLYYLNRVWDEFCRQFGIPLVSAQRIALQGPVHALDPWRTGQSAWDWLDAVRTKAARRYVLDVSRGAITFPTFASPAYATIDREAANYVSVRRSVENAAEGVNQYADAVGIHWVDDIDRFDANGDRLDRRDDVWEFAVDGDWRDSRRLYVEDRSMPRAGALPLLAAARLQRVRRWRRITTVTIPHDPQAAPFADLSQHPQASSVQSIVFDYRSGDVTTTYLEADA